MVKNAVTLNTKNFVSMKNVAHTIKIAANVVVVKIIQLAVTLVLTDGITVTHVLQLNLVAVDVIHVAVDVILVAVDVILVAPVILAEAVDVVEDVVNSIQVIEQFDILKRLVKIDLIPFEIKLL